MAEFNPVPQAQNPGSYVGLSEGLRSSPNTAIGTLFEGLATALDQGVKEQDRNIKANIEEDIFAQVDSVQAEFGIPEATDLEADAEEASFRTSPAGVRRSKEQLDRLQMAYERGALKESHYWARLNSVVRQLRGKYPGYRSEIDQMVASVTGARPANALRNALMAEWEAEQSKKGEYDKLVERAAFAGRLPADFYERQAAGNPYSPSEIIAYVARKERDEAEIQDRRAALALEKDMGEANEKNIEKAFRVEATRKVITMLQDTSSVFGANYQELQKRIAEAQSAAAAGTPMNAMETNQLRTMIGQLRMQMETAINQSFYESWDGNPEHSYMANLSDAQRQAIITTAMAPIDILEKALDPENPYGVLGSLSAYLEAMKQEDSRKVLEQYPHLREMKAFIDAVGADAFREMIALQGAEGRVALDKVMIDWWNLMSARLAVDPTGDVPSVVDAFDDGIKHELSEDFYNGIIRQWTATADQITEQKLPLEVVQSKVQFMFGPKSYEILSRLNAEDGSAIEYFRKVSSPAVTRQMLKLKEQGDIDSWNTYRQWTANTFQILFRRKIQDLQDIVTRPENFKVEWDERNNRFKIQALRDRLAGTPMATSVARVNAQVQKQFEELNIAIQNIAPIIEDAGGATGQEVLLLLTSMGYDPNEVRPTILQMIVEAIRKRLSFGQEKSKDGQEKSKDSSSESGISKEKIMKFLFGKAAEGTSLYEALQMEPVVSKYGTEGE